MRMQDQIAVITGGANGIGRAIAVRYAQEGADVVVADLQADRAAETVAAVEAQGRKAVAVELDAADPEANQAMAGAALDRFGRIDVLVTAAGISHGGYHSGDMNAEMARVEQQLAYADNPAMAFCDIALDDWQRVLDVNLTGTFLAMQACARPMIESGNGGRIVTIASIAAKHPDAGPVPYTASKAAVWMLTKKAARELAPAGIRVNAIGPGFIATHMTAVISSVGDRQQEILAAVPMGRLGEPDEIAKVAVFLAGDDSSYLTGEIIHPDGGWFTE
ncbi:MAG: SDR family NAD(P)-dependent oxidoreductase [Acidimicrobiales bacterium]